MDDDLPKMPWMLDFKFPPKKTKCRSCKVGTTRLDHISSLKCDNPKKCPEALTGVACHLDLESANAELIERIINSRVSILCLDMLKGSDEENYELLDSIQSAITSFSMKNKNYFPIAIVLELAGFKIRTGKLRSSLANGSYLYDGDEVFLTVNENYKTHCDCQFIYINYTEIMNIVAEGDLVYFNFGQIVLQITQIDHGSNRIKCLTSTGGRLESGSIVHIPQAPISIDLDKLDKLIDFACEFSIDGFIISNTQNINQIEDIQNILEERDKSEIMVLAKIEDSEGVDNIDEILEAADGIVISRAELGIELPPEKLFLIQKSIVAKCNQIGKPVMVTTHFLNSMFTHQIPTRAEVLDAANACLDGADCLQISDEIVKSKNVEVCTALMKSIFIEVENTIMYKEQLENLSSHVPWPMEGPYVVAMNAVDTALKANAACIIVLTRVGRMMKLIARFKPNCPIIAVTRIAHVARQAKFWRAVFPLQYIGMRMDDWAKDSENQFDYAIKFGKCTGLIKGADVLVMVSGSRQDSPYANMVKLVCATQNNCRILK